MAGVWRKVQLGAAARRRSLGLASAALLIPGLAAAEVVDRGPDHFVLRHSVTLETATDDIRRAVGDVGAWWDGAHTYSGKASNMTLALTPGGCFCEAEVDGATFEHGRVASFDPETGVRLDAALGPLNGKATTADWSIGWTGASGGQEVVMTYVVRGPGLGAWADGVDTVMTIQFNRLARFIEYGEPAA